jgi:uncharacterized membrane protein YcfT
MQTRRPEIGRLRPGMDRMANVNFPKSGRVDWVDYAKGLCIIMVVTMHSTLGVEAAVGQTGWMHAFVEFARPFRMPDFFMISGLFLANVINRDWRTYLDRKVVHFAYFYVLWVTIQFAVKAPNLAAEHGWGQVPALYLLSFIEPFGTLWFIYLLPIFFVVTKATRGVPPLVIWLIAAGLEIAPIDTGWTVIDEFAARFVYFYSGYIFAARVFGFAGWVQAHPWRAALALDCWISVNGALVFTGLATLPGVSLALGFAGACAVIAIAALMAKAKSFDALRYCGENSIVIYLSFFLPMAISRGLLIKSGLVPDVGAMAVLVTLSGVLGSLLIWWAARNTVAGFLFNRPEAFYLTPRERLALQPAE